MDALFKKFLINKPLLYLIPIVLMLFIQVVLLNRENRKLLSEKKTLKTMVKLAMNEVECKEIYLSDKELNVLSHKCLIEKQSLNNERLNLFRIK